MSKGWAWMKRTQFYFHGNDQTKINAYRWENEENNEIQGIVQLAHGMGEHILRYEHFCTFLVDHGFIVYGNDHRGHGETIKAPDDRGFFSEKNGFEKVVNDMKQLTDIAMEEHPHLPVFLFGHSLGSFLARRYIQLYGQLIHGVILSGTGGDKGIVGKAGLLLAKWERKRKGPRTPSLLLDTLTFGSFNKNFVPVRTDFDFLTRDETIVDAYIEDKKCGFVCTTGFFIDLIHGIDLIHRPTEWKKTPKLLPIFLIAGEQDPVGNNGIAVEDLYEQFQRHGYEQVSFKLYEDARHEILNELNKEEVYEDILKWIQVVLKGGDYSD